MVMILVQTPNGDLLFGAPQLALDVAVFPASAVFQCQSAVGPQLSLGAKTMRGLDQRYRQRRTNGSERWNLPQLGGDGMLPTLRYRFSPSLLAQVLQHVQLLVDVLGPTARP